MPAACKSAFDVAYWFADVALDSNEYLQPQKLQRLMFLAQAYYAVIHDGATLMPAVFVADETGPVEPNVYLAFSKGRPDLDVDIFLPEPVETLLDSVWRRFGHHSTERLNEMTMNTLAYKQATMRGKRAEIRLDAMRLSFARAETTPGVDQVVRPKVMRTQSGKAVAVRAWNPTAAPLKEK